MSAAPVGLRYPKVTHRHPPVEPLPPVIQEQKINEHKNITLTEVVTLTASHAVPRLQEAHMNFTFGPNEFTGSQYTITSTVYGTDGESSWTQYLCDKYPCEV